MDLFSAAINSQEKCKADYNNTIVKKAQTILNQRFKRPIFQWKFNNNIQITPSKTKYY